MKNMNRFLSLVLAICMVLTMLPGRAAAIEKQDIPFQGNVGGASAERLESPLSERFEVLAEKAPESACQVTAQRIEKPANVGDLTLNGQTLEPVEALYAPEETVRAIVVLEDKGLLERGFTANQLTTNSQAKAAGRILERQQNAVMAQVTALAADAELKYHYTIALNGMAVELPYGSVEAVSRLPGVRDVFLAPQYSVPEDMSDDTMEPYTYATSTAVGAVQTWDAGYAGEGMRIAIIDTGLDLDHPSFAAAPQSPSLTVEELAPIVPTLNAASVYTGLSAERVYYSEKVPFIFNYVDGSLDVTHDNDDQGDHGTHVAGISAANPLETTEVVGVAPEAQVLVMKVFGANGGAYFDDLLACLEDCYAMNVDVANLSLGTPAGFSSVSPYIDEIFSRILDSDMVVAIAAGNSYSAAYMNGYGTNLNLTDDPDIGIMSSPASYIGATAVASVENVSTRFNYVELENGVKVPYNDVASQALSGLYNADPEHKAEFVMIPGTGTLEDFEGFGPSGDYAVSIAVIQRGVIDFATKQINAATSGFNACIVWDNVQEDMLNMADAGIIPNVFITMEGGEAMLEAAGEDRRGVLYLKDIDETATVVSSYGGQMSDFSSWGVTPDLQLNPDVTAPGGNIYSTLTNGHYGMMSGTSMASPQIAGMSALILQYLHENYPKLSDAELHTVAESLLMSTATPVMEYEGVPYSPRKQGAGNANVMHAVTSPVYLTVDNGVELTPKVSFGDDHAKTGVYHFRFTLNNLTSTVQRYTLDGQAMTDQFVEIGGLKFMGETSRGLDAQVTFSAAEGSLEKQYDYNADGVTDIADVQAFLDAVNGLSDVKDGFDLTADGTVNTDDVQALYELVDASFTALDVVEVPANGSAEVYVTVTLSEADKAYMDENYANGIYVDGFVRAYAETADGVDLSLPFLGFYGDWSAAPAIDDAWYYDPNAIANRYVNVLFTDYGTDSFNLGLNPYILEDYDPAHNVLSPNGDGYSDEIMEIYLGMLRSAKLVDFTWLDAEGNELFNAPYEYASKNYFFPAYGIIPPLMYTEVCPVYDFRNRDGSYAVENMDRVQLEISAYLDDGDDMADQVITTDIVIDTEAPVLDPDSLDFFYSEKTDSRMIRFTVSDNYDLAAVVPLTKGGAPYEYIPVTTKIPGVDGESTTIILDVSDYDGVFQLALCDYGTNETYYEISFSGEQNYNEDSFYGYRLFSTVPGGDGNIYLTEAYNGWSSFQNPGTMLMHTSMFTEGETYTYAAEYVDEYIIGIDANNTIYATRLGQWDRTDIGKLEAEIMFEFYPGGYEVGDYYMRNAEFPALDMAFDYTTDTLYVLTDESLILGPNTGGHLLTVDWLTGETTYVGKVSGLTDDHQALTLACDNDGVLYTVDAMNGDLYTIDKATAEASFVGATGYMPLYQQSMTVDHETNKLYWASYQGFDGENCLFEVDKTTGALTNIGMLEYGSQMSGLFKPYNDGRDLVPDEADVTDLLLSTESMTLKVGGSGSLSCQPLPYYAQLDSESVTWTSDDPGVATVSGGVVTAVSRGTAHITASVDGLTATCQVTVVDLEGELYVFDFGTDLSASNAWLKLNVNEPQNASVVPDATTSINGFLSAAYVDGFIYAFDSAGAFYRLDAATMRGEMLKGTGNTPPVIGMAFNYADGYMYAMTFDGVSSFALYQVNLNTGELRQVMTGLESMYGTPLGGMAIDREGRFYFMNLDSSDNLRLDSFKLTFDGWMYFPEGYASAPMSGLSCTSFGSMVWSEHNNGIFWANEQGQLYWLGAELKNVHIDDEWGGYDEITLSSDPILMGQLGSTVSSTTGMAMNMGLLEIPADEPALPEVAIDSATMGQNLVVAVTGSVKAGVNVEPWNARYSVRYTIADPAVASVDANGTITGLAVGETTLTAEVLDTNGDVFQTLNAGVKVVNSDVDVYCFMLTDGGVSGNAWLRVNGANPAELTVEGNYNDTVYAAAYYDGTIYAVANGGEAYGYKNRVVRINSGSMVIEEVLPAEVSFNVRDMAFDYTTGTMYAIAQGGDVTGGLSQMNLTTGEITVVMELGREIAALSCDANGQLFVLTADGMLGRLDKYTGEITEISYVAGMLSGYQGMHYDHTTGNTYWGYDALYLVDTENGSVSKLGRIGDMQMLVGSVLTMPENEPEIPASTAVTGVSLPEKAALIREETLQLTATVLPVSVAQVDQSVVWSSSDESVATVDENGLVTAISGGTATITATAVGYTDECTVTVLDEPQKFYAYDELSHSWMQLNTETGEMTAVKVETDLSPIVSAATVEDKIYAYDKDGYFYEIDPETFERTKLSDGIYGMTRDAFDGYDSYYTVKVEITDLSYDPAAGKLFGLLNGVYDDQMGIYEIYSALVEVNLEPGRLNLYTYEEMDVGEIINISSYDSSNGRYRPGNLLVKDGYAYSMDTWISGILNRVSLMADPWMDMIYAGDPEQIAHVGLTEWGMYYDSRSFVYDPLFDTTYVLHDLGFDDMGYPRSDVTLYTIDLGNASLKKVCSLGRGIVLNSLIIL